VVLPRSSGSDIIHFLTLARQKEVDSLIEKINTFASTLNIAKEVEKAYRNSTLLNAIQAHQPKNPTQQQQHLRNIPDDFELKVDSSSMSAYHMLRRMVSCYYHLPLIDSARYGTQLLNASEV
jgi:hypothetical protein